MQATLLTLAVYATLLLAGLRTVLWLHPDRRLGWPALLGRALLAGPTVLVVQMAAMHHAGLRYELPSLLLPWWLLAAFSGRSLARGLRASLRGRPPAELLLAAIALLLFAVTLRIGLLVPVHSSDAIHNFAVPARAFETSGHLAPAVLRDGIRSAGRVEYPPLVALNEAVVFLAAGSERALAIKPLFALGQLAFLLLALELFAALLRPRVAIPAALLFLCLPGIGLNAQHGTADVTLTATVLLLALEGRALLAAPSAAGAWRLAAWAGACALTKNEGIPLALAAGGLLVVLAARRRLRPGAAAGSVSLLLALTLWWPAFKRFHGIEDFYLGGAAQQDLFANLSRLPTILGNFAQRTVGAEAVAGWWGPVWHVTLLSALLAAVLRPGRRRALALTASILAAHVALYVLVFVMTPHDVLWHLHNAGGRLLLHTTPWLVLLLVEALRGLESGADGSPVAPLPLLEPAEGA